jgi:hypothetical protein
MKIKESMKRHTERGSPGGGGDRPGVSVTEKPSAEAGGGVIRLFDPPIAHSESDEITNKVSS